MRLSISISASSRARRAIPLSTPRDVRPAGENLHFAAQICLLRPPVRLDSISRPHVIGLAAVITSSRELLREERVLAA